MFGNFSLIEQMTTALNTINLAENVNVVLCPSFPYLQTAAKANNHSNVFIGAQTMNDHPQGAFTGEISAEMLKEMSTQYVILGHSERRHIYKETSTLIALKVKTALNAGLKPILCIGETEEQRTTGQTESALATQLQAVIDEIGIKSFKDVVVSYEPLWAIGTGKTASPEMAQATHVFIREFFAKLDASIAQKLPILYGGSVNATNCEKLFAEADIDGGLIGGASLKVDEFCQICLAIKG